MNNELYKQAAQLVINDIDRKLSSVAKPLAEPDVFLSVIEDIFQTARNARHLLYNTVFEVEDSDDDLNRLVDYLKNEQKKYGDRYDRSEAGKD